MKKTFGFLLICATLAILSLPVWAHNAYSGADEAMQEPCSAEAKGALYAEFYKELRGDQAKAYEAAKKYVACPADTTEQPQEAKDAEAKRVEYLKGFIAKFEKARRKDQFNEAVNKSEYPKVFEQGKQYLIDDPDNVKTYMEMALAGAVAQLSANDTITYAQKALEMIEAGKTPPPETGKTTPAWGPHFESKDDALAKLNYAIGTLKVKDSPEPAIPYLIKAASYNSKIKQTPLLYASLADAYERGPYAKQSADYKAKFGGQNETPESKLALENINQIIDREIDADARAVALAGTDPNKANWMGALTDLYKFRHDKSDTGLTEMIAGILAKPLPPVPTPLTSLPTPVTPPSGSATGTTTPATTTGSQPKPTATPVKPPTTQNLSKDASTRPKTRQAHARP